MKEKLEAFLEFHKFKVYIEKQSEQQLKVLRTYGDEEFLSVEFNSFCEEFGFKRQLKTSYTPQKNGVVEQKNQSLVEIEKSMLKAKRFLKKIYVEAIHTTYLLNKSSTGALIQETPFEGGSLK